MYCMCVVHIKIISSNAYPPLRYIHACTYTYTQQINKLKKPRYSHQMTLRKFFDENFLFFLRRHISDDTNLEKPKNIIYELLFRDKHHPTVFNSYVLIKTVQPTMLICTCACMCGSVSACVCEREIKERKEKKE